mmetsp:Transcript_2441/g.7248  ORF Transcript_2441/g.7248 Transcript_2441/m.7248 type:complete len:243 (+) Transcript_2441:194-922(+)
MSLPGESNFDSARRCVRSWLPRRSLSLSIMSCAFCWSSLSMTPTCSSFSSSIFSSSAAIFSACAIAFSTSVSQLRLLRLPRLSSLTFCKRISSFSSAFSVSSRSTSCVFSISSSSRKSSFSSSSLSSFTMSCCSTCTCDCSCFTAPASSIVLAFAPCTAASAFPTGAVALAPAFSGPKATFPSGAPCAVGFSSSAASAATSASSFSSFTSVSYSLFPVVSITDAAGPMTSDAVSLAPSSESS